MVLGCKPSLKPTALELSKWALARGYGIYEEFYAEGVPFKDCHVPCAMKEADSFTQLVYSFNCVGPNITQVTNGALGHCSGIVRGHFTANGQNHGKPTYKKDPMPSAVHSFVSIMVHSLMDCNMRGMFHTGREEALMLGEGITPDVRRAVQIRIRKH